MSLFLGTSGNDVFHGGADDDSFHLEDGGDDTATGGSGGSDQFFLGATLTATDRLDGGPGPETDYLYVSGDYSAGVTFAATTMRGMEEFQLASGFSYDFTLNDGNIAAGATLIVDASGLGALDSARVNAGAEKDGVLQFMGGAGADTFLGGAGADSFDLHLGGADKAIGRAGNDSFNVGAVFTAQMRLDGGDGFDFLTLNGDYSAGVKLGSSTIANIEDFIFTPGHSYKIVAADGNVGAGQTLQVYGPGLGTNESLIFDGHKETDGRFTFFGGQGADKLTGGAGDDVFRGGGGADVLTGGAGSDTFGYGTLSDPSVSDSSAAAPDRITDLSNADFIDISYIDADVNTPGDQAFTLVSHFTNVAGQAMLHYAAGSDTTTLSLDVDGDGVADGKILLTGDHTDFTHFFL